MHIDWLYVRDAIVVNDAFTEEIRRELAFRGLGPGTTLAVVAREIRHAPGYVLRLSGHPLIVVADTLDTAGGAIDVSGDAGTDGQHGGAGVTGHASAGDPARNRPGGPGETGTAGQPGTQGAGLSVY